VSPPAAAIDLPLSPEVIHLWHDALDRPAAEVAACHAVLSSDERARAARLRTEEGRSRFIVGRAVLRRVLGRYTGQRAESLRFVYNAFGKPALEPAGVHFNMSHAAHRVLIAVSMEPVGVDLEQVRALDYWAMARAALPAQAQAELAQTPGEELAAVFFRLWTQHEARAKACGGGLAGHVPPIPAWDLDVAAWAAGEPGDARFYAAIATDIANPQFVWQKMP